MTFNSLLSRREWLSAAGVLGASLSGWLPLLAQQGAAQGGKHKSCILLWMDGGPSHIDTFDPKPDAVERIRGELKPIATSIAGIQVSERFPKLAALMQHAAILRGMSTEEADHGRARIYMHTGYKPEAAGVSYPSLGAIVSAEIGDPDAPLPNYVVTGLPGLKQTSLATSVVGSGYLGPRHQPLVPSAAGLENLQPLASDFDERVAVLEQLEQGFARTTRSSAANAHQTILARTVQLIRSGKGKTAFDLSQEPAEARAAYGETGLGRSCLLARRLVEAGVAFVEISVPGWDTHDERTAETAKGLMTQVDAGMATLVSDLKSRGLLDSTLIIWMGEFGRTPQTNGKGGRDHYARAWSTVLAGGGIQGGQAIGKTDRDGAAVTERPISVVDFMATVCQILGIDYTKKREMPNGRPIRLVDKGAKPIKELLG